MKKRRLALAVMALCCIFMMAVVSPALAENRVEVKVTSEPIPEHSPCDKAGGYTMEFDSRTEIYNGQQITIDLPPDVTLCRTIDMAIRVDDTVYTIPNNLQDARSCYMITDPNSPATPGATITGALDFVITGAIGSQRVTIDVVEAGSSASQITVGDDAADRFVLKFLDFPAAARIDVFTKDNTGAYTVASDIEDNIRCIDVSQYNGNEGRVKDNIDSRNDRFTFIPSDPQVAHPMAPGSYTCVNCDKAVAGNILVPVGGQNLDPLCEFDYESGYGYCAETNSGTNKIMMRVPAGLPDGAYSVVLKIEDTPGVYWSSQAVSATSDTSISNLCDTTQLTPFPTGTYYRANGAVGAAIATSDCSLGFYNKVVKVITGGAVVASPGDTAIWVDLPKLLFDSSEVVVGSTVKVKVWVNKFPCGVIADCEREIGVIGCSSATSDAMLYPYFTNMLGDAMWDGIAVTNLSAYDGVATLYIYEADGDTATYELPVKANSISTVSGAVLATDATPSADNTGVLGDALFYVKASTDFAADGLGMMADPQTGESIGYLVRK